MTPITDLLADDKSNIPYRPSLNGITGNALSSILLTQILYWAKKDRYKAFFKFKEPCGHKLYKDGDSWTEELGFSRTEFDTALKRISQKVRKGDEKRMDALVWFWTDMDRVTWYEANPIQIEKRLSCFMKSEIYVNQESRDSKSGILPYVNQESCFTKINIPAIDRYSETTTETTTEEEEPEISRALNLDSPPQTQHEEIPDPSDELFAEIENTAKKIWTAPAHVRDVWQMQYKLDRFDLTLEAEKFVNWWIAKQADEGLTPEATLTIMRRKSRAAWCAHFGNSWAPRFKVQPS